MWVDEIKLFTEYRGCSIFQPPSIFEDKTLDLKQFNEDGDSELLARVVKAMNNKSVIMNNVLCPWTCSASCRDAGRLAFDIMIQRMLPKVILILYSNANQYRFVQSSSNRYFCENCEYPMIMLNEYWRVKPSVILEDGHLKIITCKYHDGGNDKLTLFAPESPHGHIFNAEISDQLAPCVRKHRVSKQMKAHKFCTKHRVETVYAGYTGVSTMDLTTHSNFNSFSEILTRHESASLIGRNDINLLLSRKVSRQEITSEHADRFV